MASTSAGTAYLLEISLGVGASEIFRSGLMNWMINRAAKATYPIFFSIFEILGLSYELSLEKTFRFDNGRRFADINDQITIMPVSENGLIL